jgi:anti-sigma factor RsiW
MLKKHHDCKEIVTNVHMLLDGELNPKEEQDVLCELQRCMHCLDEYNLQGKFKKFLTERLEKKSISEECRQKIKEQINQLND